MKQAVVQNFLSVSDKVRAIATHMERKDKLDDYTTITFTNPLVLFRKKLIDSFDTLGKRKGIAPLMQELAGRNAWNPDDINLL